MRSKSLFLEEDYAQKHKKGVRDPKLSSVDHSL